MSPTGSASGAYRIRIRKNRLNDTCEANDSVAQARTYGAGQVFLGNVINSSGNPVGFNDYYTLHIDEPKHVRIAVANAGLASGEQVTVSLYDANHTLVASEYYSGNANGCTLTHDLRADWAGVDYPPFPGGDWHILISDSGTNSSGGGSPSAYGLGDPPAAYTRTDGYTISMTLTP